MRILLPAFVLLVACADDEGGFDVDGAVMPPDAMPADAMPPDADPLAPESLEETGLYADFANETLADGVREFEPEYELWSDGATKRRWVYIPGGETIDTSDMDFWSYPVGTKLWKEFTRDGTRVETRLLYKTDADNWYMMAFAWNEAQTEALAARDGIENALGTQHDIPAFDDCEKCHFRMPDIALGFTAIQLDHGGSGVSLETLITDGLLSDPPSGSAPYYDIPGDATAQAALGYLHANCGGCHHAQSPVQDTVPIELRLEVGTLTDVTMTPTYETTYEVTTMLSKIDPGLVTLIEPGSKEDSIVWQRMNRRDMKQMPPLATEDVDTAGGLADVGAWIDSL